MAPFFFCLFLFLTRVKKYFWTKITKAIKIRVSRVCFLTFLINFLFFANFDQKSPPKNHFLVKIPFLVDQKCQNFQKTRNQSKSEKTFSGYMYLDGLGQFLVIFLSLFFFTLVQKNKKKKKKRGQKSPFWRFLRKTIFIKKSDYLNRFLVKFPF